jgi:pSer/pThr/pTyr-binding forkhead associated (FHA) protein
MDQQHDEPMTEIEEAPVATAEETAVAVTPRLIVKRAGAETEEVFYFAAPAVIGRFDPSVGPVDIDLGNIPEGTYVSRKHAKITEEGGVYKVTDLGSSNGTYLLRNGDFERVEESEIVDGEEIALGNARFVFRLA